MRVGWVGCAAALLLVSCDRPSPNAAPSSEVGRYVIVHSPQGEQDTILLDTATGATWSRYERTDAAGAPAWDPMPKLPAKHSN